MTEFEDVARQRLNVLPFTPRRHEPAPMPWYERIGFLIALAMATIVGAFLFTAVMFSLEVVK